ncbi:MAG: aldehyde dehydrogenase family protein [Saprospiraceae bacterium]|nr:aldehyde dehydrogenase family protein [Saprospiraceae bacterium]
MKLYNFAVGRWVEGTGQGQTLYDASTGAEVAIASSDGLDFDAMLDYGRKTGNKNLRRMTFQERGRMLKALAMYLMERKEKYYESSYKTGATRVDSWIDIEGGIGNLFANASLRRKFPDLPYFAEGDPVGLSKGGTFMGHHILVPKEGVAVHINAFNFPVWGMLEKCAVNWLAGMPAIVKPATLTSFVTESVVRDIITSGILPDGALQLICGNARTLLDHVNYQDVVTFTGSAATGIKLKSNPNIIREAVPFNMEADSLAIGDPRKEGVRMGALAGQEQVREVKDKLNELMLFSEIVYGDLEGFEVSHGAKEKGAYMPPVLLRNDFPFKNIGTHDIEAFGPISTIMPYNDLEDAIELTRKGKGSLCSSIVTFDNKIARDYVIHAATHHGRILVLNRESAAESTGHGSPMPLLVHGGPGRAGGGEEMGGMRGVKHYMQRCAIQGTPTTITAITQQYQYGGNFSEDNKHPFKKYFDELEIGETLVTHKRTVTDADIVNFANVSWDHFYAHTDATALDGTPFTQRVAHGYFVLSAAAGLFVDAAKGPVMLNYGLEECRFTKPVYPGMTIGVRLTVKEKIAQEKRDDEDYTKGIVKWLVDVYDETGETVAIATILTIVKMKANQ